MAIAPETQAQLQLWREKALRNELTLEECRQAMAALREDRAMAAKSSAASKSKKAAGKATVSSDDLLSQLDAL